MKWWLSFGLCFLLVFAAWGQDSSEATLAGAPPESPVEQMTLAQLYSEGLMIVNGLQLSSAEREAYFNTIEVSLSAREADLTQREADYGLREQNLNKREKQISETQLHIDDLKLSLKSAQDVNQQQLREITKWRLLTIGGLVLGCLGIFWGIAH